MLPGYNQNSSPRNRSLDLWPLPGRCKSVNLGQNRTDRLRCLRQAFRIRIEIDLDSTIVDNLKPRPKRSDIEQVWTELLPCNYEIMR